MASSPFSGTPEFHQDSARSSESVHSAPPSTAPGWRRDWFPIATVAALAVLALINAYLIYALSSVNRRLDRQAGELRDRNSRLEQRLQVAESGVGSLRQGLSAAEEQLGTTQRDLASTRLMSYNLDKKNQQARAQIATVGRKLGSQINSLRQESGARLVALSGEIGTARTDIADTRKDLTSAIGDITRAHSLIARNRDELSELRRRGERDYYEFDLVKGKTPRRLADVALVLRKADAKRQRFTLEVVADDQRIEKRDRTTNEPVQFYRTGSRTLYEVVVNHVWKDRVVGYLSTPKN